MTVQEAWLKLIDMENYENLSPSQIYSILSDYGIFKENPKLRLITKSALEYGLWNLIIGNNNILEISLLKAKLLNDGFSDSAVSTILYSLEDDKKGEINSSDINKESKINNSKKIALSKNSSLADIENFLNRVLEIDRNSFIDNNLILQNLSPLKFFKEKETLYSGKNLLQIKCEIVGSSISTIPFYLNLYIYDHADNIRQIINYGYINIKDKYSIFSEENKKSLYFNYLDISKLKLKIDYNYCFGNQLEMGSSKVCKYQNTLKSETKVIEIINYQILYQPSNSIISFLIGFSIKNRQGISSMRLSAVFIDFNNKIRQKIQIYDRLDSTQSLSLGSLLFEDKNDREYFFIGPPDRIFRSNYNKLLFPFEEISNIIIIED